MHLRSRTFTLSYKDLRLISHCVLGAALEGRIERFWGPQLSSWRIYRIIISGVFPVFALHIYETAWH